MTRALCLLFVLVAHAASLRKSSTSRKNVLYIIADDLRTEMTPFGHNDMVTPNLQKLADSSLLFTNAHSQSQMCVPSRNSFMTGRRPQTTRVFSDAIGVESFRDTSPDWTTLPGYFKKHGYWVTGVGKTFHEGKPRKFDWPQSWSEDEEYFWAELTKCPIETDVWCVVDSTDHADFEDTVILDEALYRLEIGAARAKSATAPQPFFLNVGFHKPHTPFRVPKKFFDMYPLDKIKLAEHQEFPPDVSGLAWNGCEPMNQSLTLNALEPYPTEHQRNLRRAYYASVSFFDDNVGKLLAGLDATGLADDTIVILHSDHGYQLGEWNIWCKSTNFNVATHVPMMIRAPFRAYASSMGSRTSTLVELVDVFPTAVELAGLPPMTPTLGTDPPLEGRSLVPLLRTAASDGSESGFGGSVAFSQYSRHRCYEHPFIDPWVYYLTHGNRCTPGHFTGFSVRTAEWRFTEWVAVDKESGVPMWNQGLQENATELFAHPGGLDEVDDYDSGYYAINQRGNLAKMASLASTRAELRAMIRKMFPGEMAD